MGSVWVGRHLQLDVDVAIKFMAPQLASSPDLRVRFERDAKAAAKLKSPNAVQVYDYGIEDGAPYIVMELLEGEDLDARLGYEGRLSLPATLSVLEQVGKALRRAHEIGLVHRDLKPANIFLTRQGGEQIVKVVDFGIAKSAEPIAGARATRTGALLGSPSYMSPEQVRSSSHVDHRTDLWSLGVIAFECVTGRVPFPGTELGEVIVDVCTAPIPLASEVAPDLGPEIDAFFHRALMRDPAHRFQSADELVEAFAAVSGARGALPAGAPSSRAPFQASDRTLVASGPSSSAARGVVEPTVISADTAPATTARPGVGTLSPSAQSRHGAAPVSPGRRAGILIGAAFSVAALGVGLFALLRASEPTGEPTGERTAPAAEGPSAASAAPVAPPLTPSGLPSGAQGAPPPDTAPTAAPTASASAPPSSRSKPAGNGGPASPTPASSKKSDDLLKHM